MILIVTNREDITADFVVLELKDRKKGFIRFNTEDFPAKINIRVFYRSGRMLGFFNFIDQKNTIDFSSIKSIWYRRPVMPEFSGFSGEYRKFCIRESLTVLNGVWDNLDCFWVSNPRNIYFAENKLVQLKLASQIGLPVPRTIISNDYNSIKEFRGKCNNDIIIKPIKVGILGDESVIFTNKIGSKDFKYLKHSSPLPSIYQ
jgi:glutathione synthase/RimK-type ligase-like ATP-grasp enzyme